MSFHSLSSMVPNASDLLDLEVEELAGLLLTHLNSYEGVSGNVVYQHSGISYSNFFGLLTQRDGRTSPEYGEKQPQVNQALMEAWGRLQSSGLLVERAGSSGWFFISRRGKQVTSRDSFASYLKAQMLPKRQIHPLIATKVYPAFLRGEYDTAIFQAFREVEVAIRQAGTFPLEMVGEKLMRSAFATGTRIGPLTDTALPGGEQEAMGHLFAGAFGLYRNSTAHRYVPTEPEQAAEVIMFASQLLRIVDRLKPTAPPP